MTESECLHIQGRLYLFKLYYGIEKFGYLASDFSTREHEWYIVHPSNRNKSFKEGFKVVPEQIVELISPDEANNRTQTFGSISFPAHNPVKKLVILGAGASYDFAFDKEYEVHPPLAKELFSDKYVETLNNYSGAENLSSALIRVGNDIEIYLQRYWDRVLKYHDNKLISKLINTQYYLHDLFVTLSTGNYGNRKNNYRNLVDLANHYAQRHSDQHRREYVLFVSFNYDTLLEEALSNELDYSFDRIDDYIAVNSRNILYLKPHGSCNWVRKFKPNTRWQQDFDSKYNRDLRLLARGIYSEGINLSDIHKFVEEEVTIINTITDKNHYLSKYLKPNFSYYPWLLIPYREKDDFIMPSEHHTVLTHQLNSVEEILIIGWKGSEVKFQQVLQQHLGGKKVKITCINNGDDFIKEEFKKNNILPNAEWIGSINDRIPTTFSDYMDYCIKNPSHFFSG